MGNLDSCDRAEPHRSGAAVTKQTRVAPPKAMAPRLAIFQQRHAGRACRPRRRHHCDHEALAIWHFGTAKLDTEAGIEAERARSKWPSKLRVAEGGNEGATPRILKWVLCPRGMGTMSHVVGCAANARPSLVAPTARSQPRDATCRTQLGPRTDELIPMLIEGQVSRRCDTRRASMRLKCVRRASIFFFMLSCAVGYE